MKTAKQLPLPGMSRGDGQIEQVVNGLYRGRDLGTFKDSMKAPVHRWFRYPAGYSYKFVAVSFDLFGLAPRDWVYDPFSGTATTLIEAKKRGINGYGVEAHAFVHWVAGVKIYWEYDLHAVGRELTELLTRVRSFVQQNVGTTDVSGVFPELIYKCYHPKDLIVLYLIREFIVNELEHSPLKELLKLALTETLRGAAAAGTGWPYISPRKNKGDQPAKNALAVFQKTIGQMYMDVRSVCSQTEDSPACEIVNVLGDSRERQPLNDGQVKLALTSPPYLNNYDYADRTRLETYFWGITHSWAEITEQFRDKLIVAATTQVTRSEYEVKTALNHELAQIAPEVYESLQESILRLAELRLQKGGRKDYDLMVALYFNDLLPILRETYRVLEPGGRFCLVLGDSAPYGEHIRTDEMIGKLGLGLGFSQFDFHELRSRGGKWKDNPQRHTVQLREGVVILRK